MGPPPGFGPPDFGPPPQREVPGFEPIQKDVPGFGSDPRMGAPPGMGPPPSMIQGLAEAWVLVFNAGQHDEGVYTQAQQGKPASILAFECTHDADHFVKLLQAKGFGDASPMRWDADQLTRFTQESGLEVTIMSRGNLPTPPETFNRPRPGPGGDPERKYPGDGTKRPDAYTAYRRRLEALFPRKPDNCRDDDCTLPTDENEPLISPEMDASGPAMRQQAMAAIDAILATHNSTIDLTMLLKSAWQKVEEDKPDQEAAEEEE